MRFHKTLGTKFKEVQDISTQIKKPAVSATLRTFLQNQSQRIDNLLLNKKLNIQKLRKIESQSLTYRQNLKSRIQQAQQKHQKKRNQFFERRVKQEKFKIDEVQRKRVELFEKIKQTKKQNQQNFRRHKSQTVDFWKTKQLNTMRYYQSQASALPLHQQSVSRKKAIERRNQLYSQQEKDKLLVKHSHFQQIINQPLKKKKKILDDYNIKLQKGYQKNSLFLQEKQKKFVSEICYRQNRSQILLKSNLKQYEKKMETKQLVYQDNIGRKKQNLTQINMKRTQSMKQCRCHKRGSSNPEAGLTQSIMLNQLGNFNSTKRTNWSVRQTASNFLAKSQINSSNVKTNKQFLKQKQDLGDEKILMIQKQITNAVKTRVMIKNQSNNLIRQARILG